MRRLQTAMLSNQNIASYLLTDTYTADADRAIMVSVYLDQVVGNGDYAIYLTIQKGGSGAAYMAGPITTFTVPSGQTAIAFSSIIMPLETGDVCKCYVKGLVGDTTTPDLITRWFELTYLRPTVAGRTLDVSATGEAGLDFDNVHDASTTHTLTNITVPTVAQVTGLDTSKIDAAISTRLASSAYTAPDNAGIAAIPTNPLLANDGRLNHLDADVSSRLAGSAYTAPDNAGIAAIPTNPLLADDSRLDNLDGKISEIPTAPSVVEIDTQLSNAHGAGLWGGSMGSGAIDWHDQFIVKVDGLPRDGVFVRFTTDQAGLHTVASGYTNTFGKLDALMLDAGTYYVRLQLAGANFAEYYTEVVA